MKSSQHLKNLLEVWEGVRQQVYLDSGGEATIGIGHLLTRDEKASGKIFIDGAPVRYDQWLSVAECRTLLEQDLKIPEKAVSKLVFVSLNQNQSDALVSFIYNVGENAFKNSTLLKLLNDSKFIEVPTQLRRWNKCAGRTVQGLINRREKEIKLWNEVEND